MPLSNVENGNIIFKIIIINVTLSSIHILSGTLDCDIYSYLQPQNIFSKFLVAKRSLTLTVASQQGVRFKQSFWCHGCHVDNLTLHTYVPSHTQQAFQAALKEICVLAFCWWLGKFVKQFQLVITSPNFLSILNEVK